MALTERVPSDHKLDGRYAVEPYPDGSGWFISRPCNGRSGYVLAHADTPQELQRWARKRGAKDAVVIR